MNKIALDTDHEVECFRCGLLISAFEPKVIHGLVIESGKQRLIVFCLECVEELAS